MNTLTFSGSPFDRGVAHGRALRDQILPRVEQTWRQSHPEAIRPVIDRTANLLEKQFSELNAEIRGIAEGAQLPFEQVFLYNNRSLLREVEACSHLAVHVDGRTFVGMNKDVPLPFTDHYFVKKSVSETGLASIGYGHAGRVWGYGMNSRGLCAAGTAAHPRDNDHQSPTVGLYFLGPIVLGRCADAIEARDLVMGLESISEGGNLLLADKAGNMFVIELSPKKRVVRQPENGRIFSSNFYASGHIPHKDMPDYLRETTARFATIRDMLCANEKISTDRVQAILAAHREPGAVCRHGDLNFRTQLAWTAEPAERRFGLCDGYPCRGPFGSWTLSQ